MASTPPSSAPDSQTASDAVRRRRRRPTEDAAAGPETAAPTSSTRARLDVRRRSWIPSAWGLSPSFRVFLFLGGILAVMAFLLYNEYVIRQFRTQERDRAEIYANMHAMAISDAAPQGLWGAIFQKIIINPDISFPMIVTDHRGKVLVWKGPGLPEADDLTATNAAALREAMERMDAVNEPVSASWYNEAVAQAYREGHRVIIADPAGYAAAWSGPDLPPPRDTTAAARSRVEDALTALQESGLQPISFRVRTDETHRLVRSGADFAVSQKGAVVAWGGPSLPDYADGAAPAPAQALYDAVASREEPVPFRVQNENIIHYGDTELIGRISVAPFVTIGVLLLFVLIGWIGSRNIRRSEQRSIWVGMAKETAHQLGTPLSSLSGWLELMGGRVSDLATGAPGSRSEAADAVDSIVREMQKDMGRLTQIASRFSQIGSVPELKPGDVRDVLNETISYFRGRLPQFGRHRFDLELEEVPVVPLNAELMGWVFENLFKNAMDAMVQKEGTIRVSTAFDADRRCVRILVEDDGRGIEPEHMARVFQPGFSTKKRGWGLGLAFVRRIVEEYHGGRIHIPRSEAGEGTTFEIQLPVGG